MSVIDILLDLAEACPEQPHAGASPVSFAAQGSLPLDALSLTVAGLGTLAIPLQPAQASALHAFSRPAKFGLRDRTILDRAVRDGGEVASEALHLQWAAGMAGKLETEVARGLGMPRAQVQLHQLLVYGAGQFFRRHQDTEKADGMVATLVLIWPSPHLGGELHVQLGEEGMRFASQHLQRDEFRWFAFFADCRHEVLPVEEGWRVALTFDVSAPAQPDGPRSSAHPGLTRALEEQFGLDGEVSADPYVFLLEHEYSEHGLDWHLLKGTDRMHVTALRAAAESLGLSVHLALAELHESWTADADAGYRRGHRGGTPVPRPDELIEREFRLDYWVDAHGRVSSRTPLRVDYEHVEGISPIGEEDLVNEEYEGYMGNYGETLDYWYRRAALVIQSPQGFARTRLRLEFDAVLAELDTLSAQADARRSLGSLVATAKADLVGAVASRGRRLWPPYARIAAAVDDPSLALELLRPFRACTLEPADAAQLASLESHRGSAWAKALLDAWAADRRTWEEWGYERLGSDTRDPEAVPRERKPALWPRPLPAFTQAALATGASAGLMVHWFGLHVRALQSRDDDLRQATPVRRQALLPARLDDVAEFLSAARLLPANTCLLDVVIRHVADHPALYPPTWLVPLLRALAPDQDQLCAATGLVETVTAALHQAVALPRRAADDASLRDIAWTCRCDDCRRVHQWAQSASLTPLVMAMAEPRRRHVQEQLGACGARVAATTIRQGSPHRLQLDKPRDLLARDQAERERLLQALQAVQELGASTGRTR